jgi:hypothetical protein
LAEIVSVESRAAEGVGPSYGLAVSGDLLVVAHTASDRGGVLWIAQGEPNTRNLRGFATEVSKAAFGL